MGFKRKIKYFLVHTLNITNTEAQEYIDSGKVYYAGTLVTDNILIDDISEIKVEKKIVRPRKKLVCYKFYKPREYESTLNKKANNTIAGFFPDHQDLAIAGRLDKESEGLLLLSNNGKWIQEICDPDSHKEKEYIVELDREPDSDFFRSFSAGVRLGDGLTRPCRCSPVSGTTINVVLTEGRNRQIRRMCHKLDYKILALKRIRIADFILGEHMHPGDTMEVLDFGKF